MEITSTEENLINESNIDLIFISISNVVTQHSTYIFVVLTLGNPKVVQTENEFSSSSHTQITNANMTTSICTPEREKPKKVIPTSNLTKKQKRKYRIIPPSTCKMCKKEIKGQCAPCQVKELKMLVKEKDKQLKIVRRHQVKSAMHIDNLKLKLKEKSKKLNTCKNKFHE